MSANAVDQGATGAAGGALTGTYPNPGLASASVASALAGQTVPGGLSVNASFVANLGSGTTTISGAATFNNAVTIATGQLLTAGGGVSCNGFADVTALGFGVAVREGANAKQGTAVLAAGTVTVANTSVTANSRIFLTSQADGGAPGFLRVSARVAGTSFTITSGSATDTSTVAYEIFEPG